MKSHTPTYILYLGDLIAVLCGFLAVIAMVIACSAWGMAHYKYTHPEIVTQGED